MKATLSMMSHFQEKDAELFKSLLQNKSKGPECRRSKLVHGPWNYSERKIVEITKDHVVVDVGLKSEGLSPSRNFPTHPS